MPITFLTSLLTLPLLAQAPAQPVGPPTLAIGEEHLGGLFDALAATERRDRTDPVRVAWYGDSAIVSDGYTGEIRKRLQARFGDAGPGFILAAPAFDGYLRKGVRLKRHKWDVESVLRDERKDGRYGYGGVVASSYGGAGSTFIIEAEAAPIDRVQVWHRAGPKLGDLQVYADEAATPFATASSELDVATDRVWSPPLPEPARHLRLRAAGGGLVRVYGVALERSGPGVVVDALGLVGLRARRWFDADPEHLAGQVAARRPDLIVVNFGGNERVDPVLSVSRHAAEITKLIERLRGGHPRAACLVFAPTAHGVRGGKLDPRLETIYAGQRAAAVQSGCAFFDTITAMGGEAAIASFRDRKLLGRDLAHLNPAGHREVGRLFTEWLLATYDASGR